MADNISTDTADDGFLDEATSAADANWLATLRAKAKEKNSTLAEMVATDDVIALVPPTGAPEVAAAPAMAEPDDVADEAVVELPAVDDEPTIGSPSALEDIRRMAREERERAASRPAHTPAVDASDVAPADQMLSTPTPLPDPAPAPLSPSAPPTLRKAPSALDAPKAASTAPRWAAPPRLETASPVVEPAAFQRNSPQRTTDWRLAALAIVAAMLLGIVITLVFFKDTPTAPVEDDPNVTTVTGGSAATDAVNGESGVGS